MKPPPPRDIEPDSGLSSSSGDDRPSSATVPPGNRRAIARIVDPKGQFNVIRVGMFTPPWRDAYHAMLTMPWPLFFISIAVLYLITNVGFAIAYLLGGDTIANADSGSFADAFFFSVQTMASIGYGAMYPKTLYGDIVVTIESLVGLMGLAMATGLMFARFARPTARVMFSQYAVVTSFDGVPTLMFRAANQRRNRILDAQVQVTLVQNATTEEGHFMRRFEDVHLARSHSPIFALTWTVMHPIHATSPFHNSSPDALWHHESELIVTLTGLDETFAQTIHARHSYTPDEILWDRHLVDIMFQTIDGHLAIDYSRFHHVQPNDLGTDPP
ncbi:MAG: ion channel [Elainellaceae cyanobacterium]